MSSTTQPSDFSRFLARPSTNDGLRTLPSTHFRDNHDECSICLLTHPERPEQRVMKTSCDHIFHLICLIDWLQTCADGLATCPMCRTVFYGGKGRKRPRAGEFQEGEMQKRRVVADQLGRGAMPWIIVSSPVISGSHIVRTGPGQVDVVVENVGQAMAPTAPAMTRNVGQITASTPTAGRDMAPIPTGLRTPAPTSTAVQNTPSSPMAIRPTALTSNLGRNTTPTPNIVHVTTMTPTAVAHQFETPSDQTAVNWFDMLDVVVTFCVIVLAFTKRQK